MHLTLFIWTGFTMLMGVNYFLLCRIEALEHRVRELQEYLEDL